MYSGPVRSDPLAVELHNTLYADRGRPVDGIAGAARLTAWLEAVEDRLPVPARAVEADVERFVALRGSVREVLHAVVERRPADPTAIEALNAAAAADPRSPRLAADLTVRTTHHGPTPTHAVLGTIAADAIDLVSADLGLCGAPGCVLMFVREHPRRQWCSDRCGNRARQARHYARQK
jgi:predicted RNA-binding Zn ribbon-like protein